MFNPFDISGALESVKKIYENNQCAVCDKTEGKFIRYFCGHSVCGSCDSGWGNCFICPTPPHQSTSNNTVIDDVLTLRAANASELLKTFEKAFNVDVFEYQRVSKQLKLEKEIFPECIQAPIKYSNKRKSLQPFISKKCSQLSKFPGEIIYPATTSKMENSINSVEKWLNQNKENCISNQKVSNKDDSGIVADESIIDCSQIAEDKDRKALEAVYAADQADKDSSINTNKSDNWSDFCDNDSDNPKKIKDEVPFFKKSALAEIFTPCNKRSKIISISSDVNENTNNIQITILNQNQLVKPKDVRKNVTVYSVPIQTDISELYQSKQNDGYLINKEFFCEAKSSPLDIDCSQDLFTSQDICKNTNSKLSKKDTTVAAPSIIIEETDSENSSITAEELVPEIHRFQNPATHSVLQSLDSHTELLKGPRRRPRGLTPDSSNSSDKENMDPTRAKRTKYGKKNKKK